MNIASLCAGARNFATRSSIAILMGGLLAAGVIVAPLPAPAKDGTVNTPDGGTITTTTKGNTVHVVKKNKDGVKTEESKTVKEKKKVTTGTVTDAVQDEKTVYTTTTTKYKLVHKIETPSNTTITVTDKFGNLVSEEYQIWDENGKQTGGHIKWGKDGKPQTYKNGTYADGTKPSSDTPPKYPEIGQGDEKPEKPKKPTKSKGGESKGKSKSKGVDPALQDQHTPDYETSPWHLGSEAAFLSGPGFVDTMFKADWSDQGFYASVAGTGFFGRGNHTETTLVPHTEITYIPVIKKVKVLKFKPYDNGYIKYDVPYFVDEDRLFLRRIEKKKLIPVRHDEGNFDDTAGGVTFELGYNRGDFGVGLDFLLMDGEDLFGGVGADFYWRFSELACTCECGDLDLTLIPYLVGGPTLFFGAESTGTGHVGVGLNIDVGHGVQGFVEFQEHFGSHDMQWSAVQLGVRIETDKVHTIFRTWGDLIDDVRTPGGTESKLPYHPGAHKYVTPPPPPPPP